MRVTEQTKLETRGRIVDAARELFRRRGFAETTTREIAAKAGIATGTLFNYFATKESLGLSLVADGLRTAQVEFASRPSGDESLDEALFAHIAADLRHLDSYRTFVGEVLEAALSPFASGDLDSDGSRLRAEHLERVRELIVRHGPAELVEPTVVSMHLYWTLYLGGLAFWSQDDSPHQEDTLALLDQSLRLFVASLTTHHSTMELGHES